MLAQAHILANEPEQAEPLLAEPFNASSEIYVLEAGLLAEIWKNKTEITKSQKLLIDCLRLLQTRIVATQGLGPDQIEHQPYRDLYQKFLDLYPDEKKTRYCGFTRRYDYKTIIRTYIPEFDRQGS